MKPWALLWFLLLLLRRAWSVDVEASCAPRTGDLVAWGKSLSPSEAVSLLFASPLCAKALLEADVLALKAVRALEAEARLALRSADLREQELLALIAKAEEKRELQRVTPAVEWAQSMTQLFLRVKWAHKIDAPATLDVAKAEISCAKGQLSVVGVSSTKRFELSLAVAVANCTWEAGAVGRVTITATKNERAWWPRLTEKKKGQAIHLWFDKQEDYKEEEEDLEAAVGPIDETTKKNNTKKIIQKNATSSWFFDEKGDWAHFIADVRGVVENIFDGWTGNATDFVRRQGDRAMKRLKRNTTKHLARLKRQAAHRKSAIDDDSNANISKLTLLKNKAAAALDVVENIIANNNEDNKKTILTEEL